MSIEANKAVIRGLIEATNDQKFDTIDELCTTEFTQNYKAAVQWGHATFEGHHVSIEDMIAEGDQVWARVSTHGRHSGEWKGLVPTGKQWTNTGVTFFRLTNGRVAGWESLFDDLDVLKQLGATITPPP